MKRFLILAAGLIAAATLAYAEIPSIDTTEDFRNVKWGMSKAQVKEGEPADDPIVQEKSIVYLNGSISEFYSKFEGEATLTYMFENGKTCYMAQYGFEDLTKGTIAKLYQTVYNDFEGVFGEPYYDADDESGSVFWIISETTLVMISKNTDDGQMWISFFSTKYAKKTSGSIDKFIGKK